MSSAVQISSDKYENQILNAEPEEDDNEDIAYLNVCLIWPIGFAILFSLLFLIIGMSTMEILPHVAFDQFKLKQLFYSWGQFRAFCNVKFEYEKGMYPSILRQVEIKVLMNIFFRIAFCVPMSAHIFTAVVARNNIKLDEFVMRKKFFRGFNDLGCVARIIECLSLGIIGIINIRMDYPETYRLLFTFFIAFAAFHMYISIVLALIAKDTEILSILIKICCAICFSCAGSHFYKHHQSFINDPGCSGYVSHNEACTEYIFWASYFIFNLTQLIDLRHVRIICYPKTMSGECEPLRPENFKVGGKYEKCGAY